MDTSPLLSLPAAPPAGSRSAGGAAHTKSGGIGCGGRASPPAPSPPCPRPPPSLPGCHVTPPPAGTAAAAAGSAPPRSRPRTASRPPAAAGQRHRGPGGSHGCARPSGAGEKGVPRGRPGWFSGGAAGRGSAPVPAYGGSGVGRRAGAALTGSSRRVPPQPAQPPLLPRHCRALPPLQHREPPVEREEAGRGALAGASVPPHLEHEPQQEDHGHAGHDVRMVLHDELVAQHRRVLVALLADRHGGPGAGRRRRRLPAASTAPLASARKRRRGGGGRAAGEWQRRRSASPAPLSAAPLPAGGASARAPPASSNPPTRGTAWPGLVSTAEPSCVVAPGRQRCVPGSAGRILAGGSPRPALDTGPASLSCRGSADRK